MVSRGVRGRCGRWGCVCVVVGSGVRGVCGG